MTKRQAKKIAKLTIWFEEDNTPFSPFVARELKRSTLIKATMKYANDMAKCIVRRGQKEGHFKKLLK